MSDFLRELFFESLTMLLVAEVIAIGLVLALHRQRATRRTRRALWGTAGACALLLVVQRLVVTDREAIESTVRSAARAVDEGEIAALGENIDDEFRVGRTDKQQLLATANLRLQEWQVDGARVTFLGVEVTGDEAVVRFRVACDLKSTSQSQDFMPSYWKLRCVRRTGGWKIAKIEAAEMGPGVFTKQGGMNLMPYLNLQ